MHNAEFVVMGKTFFLKFDKSSCVWRGTLPLFLIVEHSSLLNPHLSRQVISIDL
jgi:hypothetical protein